MPRMLSDVVYNSSHRPLIKGDARDLKRYEVGYHAQSDSTGRCRGGRGRRREQGNTDTMKRRGRQETYVREGHDEKGTPCINCRCVARLSGGWGRKATTDPYAFVALRCTGHAPNKNVNATLEHDNTKARHTYRTKNAASHPAVLHLASRTCSTAAWVKCVLVLMSNLAKNDHPISCVLA